MKSDAKIPCFLIRKHLRRSNKWTLLFIIFLLAIAYINLVFMNSLFNGVVETNNNLMINTRTGNITMYPTPGSKLIDDPNVTVRALDGVCGVEASAPETSGPVVFEYRNERKDSRVIAVEPAREKKVTIISESMVSGRYLEPGDPDGIILGVDIRGEGDNLKRFSPYRLLEVGDRLTVIAEGQRHDFTVRGFFKTKFGRADGLAYITDTALARVMPSLAGKATNILIKTTETGDEAAVVSAIRAAGIRGTFITWQEAAGQMKEITESFKTINAILTAVGYVIAAITIFIIIYVDITHRRYEIGVLRAIGVKSWLVSATYVLQTIAYSLLGVLLGTGIFFAVLVPYFDWRPFALPIGDVTLAPSPGDFVARGVAVIVVAVFSGLIPAVIATRKKLLDEILGR